MPESPKTNAELVALLREQLRSPEGWKPLRTIKRLIGEYIPHTVVTALATTISGVENTLTALLAELDRVMSERDEATAKVRLQYEGFRDLYERTKGTCVVPGCSNEAHPCYQNGMCNGHAEGEVTGLLTPPDDEDGEAFDSLETKGLESGGPVDVSCSVAGCPRDVSLRYASSRLCTFHGLGETSARLADEDAENELRKLEGTPDDNAAVLRLRIRDALRRRRKPAETGTPGDVSPEREDGATEALRRALRSPVEPPRGPERRRVPRFRIVRKPYSRNVFLIVDEDRVSAGLPDCYVDVCGNPYPSNDAPQYEWTDAVNTAQWLEAHIQPDTAPEGEHGTGRGNE